MLSLLTSTILFLACAALFGLYSHKLRLIWLRWAKKQPPGPRSLESLLSEMSAKGTVCLYCFSSGWCCTVTVARSGIKAEVTSPAFCATAKDAAEDCLLRLEGFGK